MQVDNKEFALKPIYKYTYSLNTVPLVMMPRSPAKNIYTMLCMEQVAMIFFLHQSSIYHFKD